jgi:hypothetical protein
MATGYVKLHRESMDHPVFDDPWLWKVFTWCIMRANFADSQYKDGPVERGSFKTGRNAAAESLNASPSSVYRAFLRLKKLGCISLKSNKHWTTITVCNYTTYQSDEEQARTTGEQQADNERTDSGHHHKNAKNAKNEKKEEAAAFPPGLDIPEFHLAWSQWTAHRREIRKPLTSISISQQLKKLSKLGLTRAIDAIEHSIANGYQGIYESKDASKPLPGKVACQPLTEDDYADWNPVTGGSA